MAGHRMLGCGTVTVTRAMCYVARVMAAPGSGNSRPSRIVPLPRVWGQILDWFRRRDFDESATLMVFGALVGLATGLVVVAFYGLIDLSHLVFIQWPRERLPFAGRALYQPLLTAGGILAAWLVIRRTRTPEGQNVADVQRAVAKNDGVIRGRPVLWRAVASAFTLGSGGSAGPEGPVAVLGSTVGSQLARRLRFQARHVKILVGCGAAAGIAGAFNAPFAGAFFALEEVLGSFSVGAFSPVVIASVVGALTVRPFHGEQSFFSLVLPGDPHPVASAFVYPLLGIACGLVGALYTRLVLSAPQASQRIPGPQWLRPVIGGLATGAIVVASGGLLAGTGHLAIPPEIFGGLAWYALLAIAAGKIVATAFTLGFGGSGGVFTPTLFIGAALGGGLGVLGAQLLPGNVVNPQAWALVGMGGMVAAATRAPLTAIFMVFEITDDYRYVVPLMIVTVVAYVTSRRFTRYGLYDGWLAQRGERIEHGVDRAVMDSLLVRDACDQDVRGVPPSADLAELAAAASRTRHGVIPVVETDGRFVGLVSHHAIREALLARDDLAPVVLAEDVAESIEAMRMGVPLREALAVMNARGLDALAVVNETPHGPVFAGLLTRDGILRAYERTLARAV
jgi:chloride channel protein, CIC family